MRVCKLTFSDEISILHQVGIECMKDLLDFFEQRNVSFQVRIHLWVVSVQVHCNLPIKREQQVKEWRSYYIDNVKVNLHWATVVTDDKTLKELTQQLTKLFSRRSANVVVRERNFWPTTIDAVQDSSNVIIHFWILLKFKFTFVIC